jgi:hypothetical protein
MGVSPAVCILYAKMDTKGPFVHTEQSEERFFRAGNDFSGCDLFQHDEKQATL